MAESISLKNFSTAFASSATNAAEGCGEKL
jgi:hypothetical protein